MKVTTQKTESGRRANIYKENIILLCIQNKLKGKRKRKIIFKANTIFIIFSHIDLFAILLWFDVCV